jgi:hypothetical protein
MVDLKIGCNIWYNPWRHFEEECVYPLDVDVIHGRNYE